MPLTFIADSIYLKPHYNYWVPQNSESSYFLNYLKIKILNNDFLFLKTMVKKVDDVYMKQGDSILLKIAIANTIKFYLSSLNTHKILMNQDKEFIDSLLTLYKLNKTKMGLPDSVLSIDKIINKSELYNIYFTSLETKKVLTLLDILSDSSKIYFIDNWASWCTPCVKELPFSKKLEKKLKNKVIVLYLSRDENMSKCITALNKNDISFQNSYILNFDKTLMKDYKKLNDGLALPIYQILYFKGGLFYLKQTGYPSEENTFVQLQNF